ncbi:predicted protein [Phaeodactylum tricornutum CCAP 1055/1]|uniref:PHD-type domain-containing protein n=2 Tax=Phaeodactylum tricornutum TaxID=2850 RepID=B7FPP0_PHATC|nr:predicted protein [Phaeodactylum tricornutum CCAP 1055/1]EEC51708.1 predicted protein [Phaeodactylum tricornutum CCAP 1055/1]|eukprot:XP_002177245.1 predicted protein [Phaeodactylum tricornutum CCAP 1055/1]
MTKSPLQTKEKFPPIGKSQKLSSNANPTQSFNQAVAHERESGKPRSSAEESVDEGCRVCGMDDNYSRLLLCEGCNGEYHTYCLTPPLEKVPVEDWYCDRCTALVEILNKKSGGEPIGSIPLIISQGSEGNSKADPSLPSNHSTKKKSLVESSPYDTADEELPMKEIDTRNGSTAPEYLDENTLRLVRLYVAKCRPQDMLNEDDVILLMHRMDRLTAYQAEFQLNIPGPANERQEVLLEEIKDEEEDHVLGREFFHKLVAKIQKENVESLEKRTLAWLKRATGIHRSSTESFVRDNTSKTGSSRTKGSGRRCTRGMVRQFRKKKSEKGLEILKGALDELEPTLGPFHSAFRKRRRSISTYDDDERSSGKQRKKQEQVQRKNQKGMKAKMNKEMKNGLKRTKPNNENKRKASPSYPNLLHALDWKRRKQLHSKRNKPGSSILLDINHAQRSLKLPKKLRNKGIVMTLPRWGSIKQAESFAPKESVFGPPRGLYSDQHYSFWSLRLMNFLQSSARTWVSHEFFYSDLDKAWYNSSALSKMARRFGVDPTISLDSAEWKCVRRALHGIKAKPRRFSRCFISEQLHERDEFRSGVRLLQQNLGASHAAYDLKSCIPVGSVVTAYSQTFGMLQRGTVLTFEARNAHYLVRFENMDFGYEYCPDSEVASHGSVLPLHVSGGAESKTTTSNAILRKYCAPAWSRSMKLATELEGCTEFTPFRSQSQKKGRRSISETDSHWAFIKEAAEEETLQCLLDVINTAAIRKSALLKAIDTVITPANSELEKAKSAIQTQEREGNLALLVLNLEKTNKTIRNSVRKIRLLYAQVYPLRMKIYRGISTSPTA